MKHLLLTLVFLLSALSVQAQKEQDFVAHYLSLYDKGNELTCMTISPAMLKNIVKLPDVKNDEDAKEIFSQLKSIRLLTSDEAEQSDKHFANALDMAVKNSARYKLVSEKGNTKIYGRNKKNTYVELVLITKDEGDFAIVDLTGNMSADFIKEIQGK